MKCSSHNLFWARLLCAGLLLGAVHATEEDRHAESLTKNHCLAVVKRTVDSGKYTEESIAQTCSEESGLQKCDFFAKALSLASGRSDFDQKQFCADITEAHFCSETLDHLLASDAVADLAYGKCMRADKGEKYCNHSGGTLGML
jgi:hypothetical protein